MTSVSRFFATALGGIVVALLTGSGCASNEVCVGEPTPCAGRTADSCFTKDGCSPTPGCTYHECPLIKDKTECELYPYCWWNEAGCGYLTSVDEPCTGLALSACLAKSECFWGTACTGAGIRCSTLQSKEACERVSECTWDVTPPCCG